jgi:acyl-CoA thioester hydrolase
MNMVRPLLVELQFHVKTYDIDYAGIVHNAVYIRWLEDLRLEILSKNFPMEEMLAQNQSSVFGKTEISYVQPLRLFDKPVGRMWVSNFRRARWYIEAEIVLDDLPVATAAQSGYFMDLERFRPIRIPQQLREIWASEATSASL